MSTIVKNGVHRAIFEEHYRALLENYKFYDRKLIILNNPDVSQAALDAVNRYGVASFFMENSQMNKQVLLLFLAVVFSSPLSAAEDIKLWYRNYDKLAIRDFIDTALQVTENSHGPANLVRSIQVPLGRAVNQLESGKDVDLIVTALTAEKEKKFNIIYEPIDKGLLGIRICLVQKRNVDFFKGMNSIADFRAQKTRFGVGSHWIDHQVMSYNDLDIIHAPVYERLFKMLKADRFECLPRSINEIDLEIARHKRDLAIEPHIAFAYPQSDFLILNKSNKTLFQRLETGIERMSADGSLQALFDKHYSHLLRKHKLFSRKVIFLETQMLSKNALSAINEKGVMSFVY